MKKVASELKKLLVSQGFDVKPQGSEPPIRFELRDLKLINPADIRARAAAVMSAAGFNGYYLKDCFAYTAAKKPWRTESEAYVELELWEDFKKVEEQQKVAGLNRAIVGAGVKVVPLASGGANA